MTSGLLCYYELCMLPPAKLFYMHLYCTIYCNNAAPQQNEIFQSLSEFRKNNHLVYSVNLPTNPLALG